MKPSLEGIGCFWTRNVERIELDERNSGQPWNVRLGPQPHSSSAWNPRLAVKQKEVPTSVGTSPLVLGIWRGQIVGLGGGSRSVRPLSSTLLKLSWSSPKPETGAPLRGNGFSRSFVMTRRRSLY